MLITKIEQQKKDASRYSIFLDHKFSFGLSGVDVLYFKLKEDEVLDKEKYEYILEHVVYEEAKRKAFNYVSAGYKTEKEVRDKLLIREYSEEIIDKVIDVLKQYNYVDDRVYAKKFIEYRTKTKKQGLFKIKHDLIIKGISEEIINEFFDDFKNDSGETIVSLIEKKAKGLKNLEYKEKQRIIGFLMRRGFSCEEINEGFKIYFESE